jgi:glutamyl-Q tRNA(Asp) synthetase
MDEAVCYLFHGGVSMRPVLRFAPSPNGLLHRGHALSAALNVFLARDLGARCLLRVEDVDASRARPEFAQAIERDLAMLGLLFDGDVLFQSTRSAAYAAALDRLADLGVLYEAFESRSQIAAWVADYEKDGLIWPRDGDGAPLYPRLSLGLSAPEREARRFAGEPFVLRLDMERSLALLGCEADLSWQGYDESLQGFQRVLADARLWGDVLLRRRDGSAAYHLAVVVDDACQGVTHVVRGLDLLPSTAVHRVLQGLLKLPAPRYYHHGLVVDQGGEKLAKSRDSLSLQTLFSQGFTAKQILTELGFEGGARLPYGAQGFVRAVQGL